MTIILEQLILLFTFMLCGYIFGKCRLINHEHSKILSTISVYMFLPCTVFNAFYKNFSVSNLTQYYRLIITSAVILIILITVSHFVSGFFSKDGYSKKVFKYTLIIPNFGYMGYALAQGLYGDEGLLHMILFAIPFSLYTYTYGFCMLTNRKLTFKQLLNPVILSILIGAVFGICGIKMPGVFEIIVNKSSACMAPVSMLLAGITISEFNTKYLFFDKKIYLVTLIRLVIIPVAVMLILRQVADSNIVRTAVLLLAMPCGLNTIVFPKLVGENCETGAKLAFISNILAMISIPLILNCI